MWRKRCRFIATLLAACYILYASVACATPAVKPPVEAKVLKLGCVMPFTGPASLWGKTIRPAMEIYTDLINSDGGLKVGEDNYKVEIYFADGDAINPSSDAAAARSLIYGQNVKAIVGYFGAGYPAVAPITTPEKVILNSSTISMGTFDASRDRYSIFGFPSVEMSINQAMAVMHAFPEAKTLCWVNASGGNVDVENTFGPVDAAIEKEYGIKSVHLSYPMGTMNFTAYIAKMADLGADVLYSFGTPLEVGLMAKQRYQMGYKWPIVQCAATLNTNMVKGLTGSTEAMQNICGNYSLPWVLKKVKVAPKYLDMANRIRAEYKRTNNGEEPYAGVFGVGVVMEGQYLEGVEMAGTTDPDQVMNTFRGGSIETFGGKFTLSGTKTYGAPVVFGYPCGMSIIKGEENVYLNEEPLWDVDHPVGGVDLYKMLR
jgi:ABC-type branched-subunit amino acid transport system substrate-binding protein